VPARIGQYIKDKDGIAGSSLLVDFGGPPYGYPADVIKACLAGLLRAGAIRIRPDAGPDITSVRDPGGRDMFTKDRDFRRADILPPKDQGITQRDRVTLCKFFKDSLGIDLDRENDAIADGVPALSTATNSCRMEQRYIGCRTTLTVYWADAGAAGTETACDHGGRGTRCWQSRNIPTFCDGVQQLGIFAAELTEQSVEWYGRLARSSSSSGATAAR
jgi:hypothetical protein